jgi:hypothetical protein
MADLDAARRDLGNRPAFFRRSAASCIFGRGIERRPFVDDRLRRPEMSSKSTSSPGTAGEVILVAKHFALAGVGQNDEFMAEVAADRPGLGAHRDRLQAQPREGAQIGDEHLVVGMRRAGASIESKE